MLPACLLTGRNSIRSFRNHAAVRTRHRYATSRQADSPPWSRVRTSGGGPSSLDVARDRSLDVARDRSLDVARDRSLDVARDRSLDVARDRSLDVAGDRSLDVARDRSLDVAGDRSLGVARDRSLDVARDRSVAEKPRGPKESLHRLRPFVALADKHGIQLWGC